MRGQSYLVRRGARYHFRRRLVCDYKCSRAITVALGTADPVEARRLVRRLAGKWDDLTMQMIPRVERGTLTVEEAERIYREAMVDEIARATAHVTAPLGRDRPHPLHHKVYAAAYRIVGRVPHYEQEVAPAIVEAEIDETWTAEERELLENCLRLAVTPMSVSRTQAKETLADFEGPFLEGAIREARSHILRGYAAAHDRAAFLEHPAIVASAKGVLGLLDDSIFSTIAGSNSGAVKENPVSEPPQGAAQTDGLFAMPGKQKFSEIIKETLSDLEEERGWKPDRGQRRGICDKFAWMPLWQGSGGKVARLKAIGPRMVYQDAAFWAPIIGTYTGASREEVAEAKDTERRAEEKLAHAHSANAEADARTAAVEAIEKRLIPVRDEVRNAERRLAGAQIERSDVTSDVAILRSQKSNLNDEIVLLKQKRRRLDEEGASVRAELEGMLGEKDRLEAQRAMIETDRRLLQSERQTLSDERSKLDRERSVFERKRSEHLTELERERSAHARAVSLIDSALIGNVDLTIKGETLTILRAGPSSPQQQWQEELSNLPAWFPGMVRKIDAVHGAQNQFEELEKELGSMRKELQAMAPERAPELAKQRNKEAALVAKVFDPHQLPGGGIGG